MTSQAPTQGPTDAGLTARVLSSEWQPIETAPKDGTLVIVFAPSIYDLSEIVCVAAYHLDAGWCVDELREVTHWMPLPTPPINPKGAA